MSDTEQQVRELGQRWAAAEQRGDVAELASMADADLTLVGPAGYVLDRAQWLARYRPGALVTMQLSWDDVSVRDYGETAIAVGVHTQRASYQGNPVDGRFRATHVLVRRDGRWLLAAMHLSPIAAPPAA